MALLDMVRYSYACLRGGGEGTFAWRYWDEKLSISDARDMVLTLESNIARNYDVLPDLMGR